MDWIQIKSQADIHELMETFGYFHDGCIKEMHYISGNYVMPDLSMTIMNTSKLKAIFQRQWKDPVIEMIFDKVSRVHLAPMDENYCSGEILGAYMGIHGGMIYWADREDFDPSKIDSSKYNDCTWIAAQEVQWRRADEYLGNEDIFTRNNAEDINLTDNRASDEACRARRLPANTMDIHEHKYS